MNKKGRILQKIVDELGSIGDPIVDGEVAASNGLLYPSRFIVGAAKCATSYLYSKLQMHPSVAHSSAKEWCFFARDELYDQGLKLYSALYSPVGERKVMIDASTMYSRCSLYPHCPERIFRAAPNARFVYVLRHPIDRSFSQYRHVWTKELHPGEPFTEEFEDFVMKVPHCIEDSKYQIQYRRYRKFFPREQILLLIYDDIRKDESAVIRKLCEFFDLDYRAEYFVDESDHANISNEHAETLAKNQLVRQLRGSVVFRGGSRLLPSSLRHWTYDNLLARMPGMNKQMENFVPDPLSPDVRKRFRNLFSSTIDWVEQMTGRSLPHWRI